MQGTGPAHSRRVTPPRVRPEGGDHQSRSRFRADIEGLRAVAVIAVVFFHAGVGFLSGGFVGVDVFYVISGFLITDLLWRELGGSRHVSFAGFWARRARRLLPAAMFVLVVTMVAAWAWMPPLEVRSVWKDGLYSALYVGNFRFAATKIDYLANTTPSPFQHYWSLGVEEQFYLVWPLLLVVCAMGWWFRRPSRGTALAGLLAISAASLGLSVWLTRVDQPEAFFLLPARAWELGIGGCIALVAPELKRLPKALATLIGWAGLGAIALSCVIFGSHTAYPGTAALLPVAGSGLVIVSGLTDLAVGPVLFLGTAAMRAIGRISYSWYLWHFPVLILVPYAIGHTLGVWSNVGLALGSAILAIFTFRFVEIPGRQASWLAARPRRGLATGAALSAVGVATCLIAASAIPSTAGHGQAPVAIIRQPRLQPRSQPPPSVGGKPPAGPPDDDGPARSALASAGAQVQAAVAAAASTALVPANLDPSLSDASSSEAAPLTDGCLLGYTATSEPPVGSDGCEFGDLRGADSIVLWGDSHAAMWFPAIDAFADADGYRLYVWTKAACPPVQISIFSPVLGRTWTECRGWVNGVLGSLASLRPSLAVLGIAPNYDSAYDVVQNGAPWLAGLAAVIGTVRHDDSKVLVMGSVPAPSSVVPDCLSENLNDVKACDFSPVGRRVSGGGLVGIDGPGDRAEESTAQQAGATYADDRSWFCTTATCVVVVDNLLVYRDDSHITVPYATYLAPLVGDEIKVALDQSPTS